MVKKSRKKKRKWLGILLPLLLFLFLFGVAYTYRAQIALWWYEHFVTVITLPGPEGPQGPEQLGPGECFDSDGGRNYEIRGLISDTYPTGELKTRETPDYCQSSRTLVEWYCSSGAATYESHNCGPVDYCNGGRCVSPDDYYGETDCQDWCASGGWDNGVEAASESQCANYGDNYYYESEIDCCCYQNDGGYEPGTNCNSLCIGDGYSYGWGTVDSCSQCAYGEVCEFYGSDICCCGSYGGNETDSDGDGYYDWEEIDAGTDPNNPNDYPGAGGQSYNCYDSDGGYSYPNNLKVTGTCTDDLGSYTDYCKDSNILREYYCAPTSNPTYCDYVDYGCTAIFGQGCDISNGRCKDPEAVCYDLMMQYGYSNFLLLTSGQDCMWEGYDWCWEHMQEPWGGGRTFSGNNCCLFNCGSGSQLCKNAGYIDGYYPGMDVDDCLPGYVYVAGTTQSCCLTNDGYCNQQCQYQGVSTATSGTGWGCVNYADSWCVSNCGGEGYASANSGSYGGVSCCCWRCQKQGTSC